jgi:hypothetical protein
MADPTLSQLIGSLLGYGPVGLAFGVCFFVIWTLYTRNTTLNDKLIDIIVTSNTAQLSTTTAINALTDLVKAGKAGA